MDNPELTKQDQTPGYSKRGIISFLISVVIIIIEFLRMTIQTPSLVTNATGWLDYSLIYCVLPIGCILGMGFGIAGLIEKNRKRLFSVLGLIFNLIAFLPLPLMWIFFSMVGLPFCLFNGSCGT